MSVSTFNLTSQVGESRTCWRNRSMLLVLLAKKNRFMGSRNALFPEEDVAMVTSACRVDSMRWSTFRSDIFESAATRLWTVKSGMWYRARCVRWSRDGLCKSMPPSWTWRRRSDFAREMKSRGMSEAPTGPVMVNWRDSFGKMVKFELPRERVIWRVANWLKSLPEEREDKIDASAPRKSNARQRPKLAWMSLKTEMMRCKHTGLKSAMTTSEHCLERCSISFAHLSLPGRTDKIISVHSVGVSIASFPPRMANLRHGNPRNGLVMGWMHPRICNKGVGNTVSDDTEYSREDLGGNARNWQYCASELQMSFRFWGSVFMKASGTYD